MLSSLCANIAPPKVTDLEQHGQGRDVFKLMVALCRLTKPAKMPSSRILSSTRYVLYTCFSA